MRPHLTFERLYVGHPEFYGQDMIDRHIRRYRWASRYLKKCDRVLDAGCGTGYGAAMLANMCKFVTAVDSDREAINYALEEYSIDNVSFRCCDLRIIKPNKRPYNTIVMIETIEHFDRTDAKDILSNFYYLLRNQGKLIITTPERNAVRCSGSPFHKIEYTKEQIVDLISQHFEIIESFVRKNYIYIVAKKNEYN